MTKVHTTVNILVLCFDLHRPFSIFLPLLWPLNGGSFLSRTMFRRRVIDLVWFFKIALAIPRGLFFFIKKVLVNLALACG